MNLNQTREKIQEICDKSNGRSQLFRRGSTGHLNGIRHYYETSAEDASFSVEPGSAEDLCEIMKAIKNSDSSVRFAVKGGGHTGNPGFSSTNLLGIQISMSRFNKISFNDDKTELTVGAGCTFDEVYKTILPDKYNIVGGGGSVGIGGWMLGGGYSFKTNQFGLGIDNLVQATVVLPHGGDGKPVTASKKKGGDPDLFWAIKGGGNNFGIATEFVLKTHLQGVGAQGTEPSGLVYGGILTFGELSIKKVKKAIIDFTKQEDPKAAIVAAFRAYQNNGVQEFKLTVLTYYDGKKPEPDPFVDFLDSEVHPFGMLRDSSFSAIDNAATLFYGHLPADVAVVKALSFKSFGGYEAATAPLHEGEDVVTTLLHESDDAAVAYCGNNATVALYQAQGGNDADTAYGFRNGGPNIAEISAYGRARWGNVMVSKYTPNLIDAIETEARAAAANMNQYKGRVAVADVWPFLPTMFKESEDSESAWPHNHKEPNAFIVVYFVWDGKENDAAWILQMEEALGRIRQTALKEGCTTPDAPVYCNTALAEVTTPQQIYRGNLDKLSSLRNIYDPYNVMGKTGGFRIPTVREH